MDQINNNNGVYDYQNFTNYSENFVLTPDTNFIDIGNKAGDAFLELPPTAQKNHYYKIISRFGEESSALPAL